MALWGKTKKAAVVPEPYLNKHGWRASDPFVKAPWPPPNIEFALLRASETVSATIWPKLPREYGQETSPDPSDHLCIDRNLDYDGCVTTLHGLSRIGASLHFADLYPDQLPQERVICDVIPTFVAAVDLDARDSIDPVAQSVSKNAPESMREDQWTRPWLNVIVFDPSRELRAHFERCLLWAMINRANYVGYKVWNSQESRTGEGLSITQIVESVGSKRVYFEGFCFWPKTTLGAARAFSWPSGFDDL